MITDSVDYKARLKEIQESVHVTYQTLPYDEPRFIIDANTRKIDIPSEFGFLAVLKDHKAETIYFEIDRYFDEHDLSDHTCVVQFQLIDNLKQNSPFQDHVLYEGIYPVTSLDLESSDGKIIFGWNIQDDVTQFAAQVNFSVRFFTINSEDNTFEFNFNTLTSSSTILKTLDVSNSSSSLITSSELQSWLDKMNSINKTMENVTNASNSLNNKVQALLDTYSIVSNDELVDYLGLDVDNVMVKHPVGENSEVIDYLEGGNV